MGALRALAEGEGTADAVCRDPTSRREHLAHLLGRLGRADEAATEWRGLVDREPDNVRHHAALRASLGLPGPGASPATDPSVSDARWDALVALYEALRARHPRSAACARLPLDFLSCAPGSDGAPSPFVAAADAYARPQLLRGAPSLFGDLAPLRNAADPARRAALDALVESWRAEFAVGRLAPGAEAVEAPEGAPAHSRWLDREGGAPVAGPAPGGRSRHQDDAPPGVWALLFAARSALQDGDADASLALIDVARGAAPLLPDLLQAEAAALADAGDLDGAAEAANVSRRGVGTPPRRSAAPPAPCSPRPAARAPASAPSRARRHAASVAPLSWSPAFPLSGSEARSPGPHPTRRARRGA